MNEGAPQEVQGTSQQALDLLQVNFTTYDHPYSMRGVLPVVLEACDSPTELESFLTPLRTANKLACWLQLPQELQEVAASTLPEKPENSYYQDLFDHVTQGKPLPRNFGQRPAEPFAIPSWKATTPTTENPCVKRNLRQRKRIW